MGLFLLESKEICANLLQDLTRSVSHCGLAIYIKKHLEAKEELWKLKYFTMQNIIVKQSSKGNQDPSSCL
jgi:hypothetical protein